MAEWQFTAEGKYPTPGVRVLGGCYGDAEPRAMVWTGEFWRVDGMHTCPRIMDFWQVMPDMPERD